MASTGLVAGVVTPAEGRSHGIGQTSLPTAEVVETPRFFVREGVEWQALLRRVVDVAPVRMMRSRLGAVS